MTGKVFLNYRRTDADAWADRLLERLRQQFPRENVFMDIDGQIPVGFPWADWLDSKVADCDLMLVLIGRLWVAELNRRSQAKEPDYVQVEIESALKRKIPVVPVLLGDAPMPNLAELPETMRPLLGLQAVRLHRTSFVSDAETLAKSIARSIALARGEAAAKEVSPPAPSKPLSDDDLTDQQLIAKYSTPDLDHPQIDFSSHQVTLRTLIDRARFGGNVDAARPLRDIDQLICAKAHPPAVLDRICVRANNLLNGGGTPVHRRSDWPEVREMLLAVADVAFRHSAYKKLITLTVSASQKVRT